MNRDKMFPTKSELQVAIALECLLRSARLAENGGLIHLSNGQDDLFYVSVQIAELCHSRLSELFRPIIYERLASFYRYDARRSLPEIKSAISLVRGWRRRWPGLYQPQKGRRN